VKPTPIAREIYQAYLESWGEPTSSRVFEDPKPVEGVAPRIDIFVWDAADAGDITLFATLGMCYSPMPKNRRRAELHFPIRGPVKDKTRDELIVFMANLSGYPFVHELGLDWNHRLVNISGIPHYPGHSALLLHPKFSEQGRDLIATSKGEVRVLNVVPLTEEEAAMPVEAMLDHMSENVEDWFRPRPKARGKRSRK
jgi:hypothetical protein